MKVTIKPPTPTVFKFGNISVGDIFTFSPDSTNINLKLPGNMYRALHTYPYCSYSADAHQPVWVVRLEEVVVSFV